jgi:DNA-nicking Smr family endonuclease
MHDPLKALARRLARERLEAPAPRPAPPEPEAEPDFRTLFADVRPLRDTRQAWPVRAHPAVRRRPNPDPAPPLGEDAGRALLHEMAGWFEPADECDSFCRDGMPASTLKRLRAGHWPCIAQLDLHGHDRYQAQDALVVFLHHARRRGQCVRIIHGKGFGSGGTPVLKRMVRVWLGQHPAVLAYCEASPLHGGSGALWVLLRRGGD